jgi:hypothetical protein
MADVYDMTTKRRMEKAAKLDNVEILQAMKVAMNSTAEIFEIIADQHKMAQKYEHLALAASLACIDLASNVAEANKDYEAGAISKGAFNYIIERQAAIHAALYNLGYTETHKVYGHPIKPEASQGGQ